MAGEAGLLVGVVLGKGALSKFGLRHDARWSCRQIRLLNRLFYSFGTINIGALICSVLDEYLSNSMEVACIADQTFGRGMTVLLGNLIKVSAEYRSEQKMNSILEEVIMKENLMRG